MSQQASEFQEPDSGAERRASRRGPRRRIVFDEGLPTFSLLFTAAFSAVVIYVSPLFCLPLLARFVPDGQNIGPLGLPVFTSAPTEALAGAALLTIISLLLLSLERVREFEPWLPMALSFPVVWILILPSALEHGGPWLSWLVFGALIAGLFGVHWFALGAARGMCD